MLKKDIPTLINIVKVGIPFILSDILRNFVDYTGDTSSLRVMPKASAILKKEDS